MTEILIVENPSSRLGRRVVESLTDSLRASGAASIARIPLPEINDAEPPTHRVLAVGGDGTVNGVVDWIRRHGLDCPVGIIPAGTGNNLAKGLGLSTATREATEIALNSHRIVSVDAGLYSDFASDGEVLSTRLFVQSGGFGFPADIARIYDDRRKNALFRACAAPLGTNIYKLLAFLGLAGQKWREVRGMPYLELSCEIDGEIIEEKVIAVFFGNEKSLGGDFIPCPRAKIDDGHIDLCILKAGTGASYLKLFQKASRGEHLDSPACIYRKSRHPIRMKFNRPVSFLADGDLWVTGREFEFQVVPACFSLIVPERGGEDGEF